MGPDRSLASVNLTSAKRLIGGGIVPLDQTTYEVFHSTSRSISGVSDPVLALGSLRTDAFPLVLAFLARLRQAPHIIHREGPSRLLKLILQPRIIREL